MIFIGVGLAARGLYSEGSEYQDAVLAQTGRRTTALDMEPFAVNTERGRRQWRQLLLAIEYRVVLADKYPGMIADDLCDYLYARSTGHIGSLMTLINRGCQRAVRSGEEKLTTELLDNIKIDAASERPARNSNWRSTPPRSGSAAKPDSGPHTGGTAIDTAVRTLPMRTKASTVKPWTPGSKPPAIGSPRHRATSPKPSGYQSPPAPPPHG
jgi:hypothetical protein